MTQQVMYEYLGTNGTVCTPVHITDANLCVHKVMLMADAGKYLTKDSGKTRYRTVTVPEEEVEKWSEKTGQIL